MQSKCSVKALNCNHINRLKDDQTMGCDCFAPLYSNERWRELKVHRDKQDRECDAWFRLLELIDKADKDKRKKFAPRGEMPAEDWKKIVTLPPEISKLKEVETLMLYGSYLAWIPPEIGEMKSLKEFVPYTFYYLHWFPYEITRCKKLKKSTVSTRALYGNYKYRPPFPRLRGNPVKLYNNSAKCSICGNLNYGRRLNQVWISLRVATDVLPLLVHTCSKKCIERLSNPPKGYV